MHNFYDLSSAEVPAINWFKSFQGKYSNLRNCSTGQMGTKFLLHNFTLKHKANVSQTVGINLESLSLTSQSRPYLQTQTPGVGRGRLLYLEINTALTAPIAIETPSGGRPMKYLSKGERACQQVPSAPFYERLMHSHVRAVPLLLLFTQTSRWDSSGDSCYGAGGGEEKEVLLMCSVTSSLHYRLKSLNFWV